MMQVAALISAKPKPNADQIINAMDDVICRCGTHPRIKRGIKAAVQIAEKGGLSHHDKSISRRSFLKITGLTIAVSVTPFGYSVINASAQKEGSFKPNVWFEITPDNIGSRSLGQFRDGARDPHRPFHDHR